MKKLIDVGALLEWLESEKQATICAMDKLGVSEGIKVIVPQHYDKIKNKIEEFVAGVSQKPFAQWLIKNHYFKSPTREIKKKIYQNKFIDGDFTRKELFKIFKKEFKKEIA